MAEPAQTACDQCGQTDDHPKVHIGVVTKHHDCLPTSSSRSVAAALSGGTPCRLADCFVNPTNFSSSGAEPMISVNFAMVPSTADTCESVQGWADSSGVEKIDDRPLHGHHATLSACPPTGHRARARSPS
jgi:hypothetical protein